MSPFLLRAVNTARRFVQLARRHFRSAFAAALMLLLAGALATRFENCAWYRAPAPPVSGTLFVRGLAGEVSIARDAANIPHIFATSEADAWFGLGFAQAQDRLGQLFWLRMQAQGRSAAHLGEAGVAADRMAKSLGLARLAARDFEAAGGGARRVLGAYSAGVNAWLAEIAAGRARAPASLPEPVSARTRWKPADSLAIAKLRAWQTGSALEEMLVLEAVVRALGPSAARAFFPQRASELTRTPAPPSPSPPRGTHRRWSAAARAVLDVLPPAPDAFRADVPRAPLRRAGGFRAADFASTAWVLDATKAQSGKPLLVAELHAPPRYPAPFYEARLRGAALDVAGATLPGVPVFWAGLNGEVAWAATHLPVLTADLVEETLRGQQNPRYRHGAGFRELVQREERLQVRGELTPRTLTVRETARGPLLDAALGAARPLSVRWSGQRTGGIDALLRLTRAQKAADIRRALRIHGEPLLAVAWASAGGEAGVQVAGFAPQREQRTGLQPVPANTASFRWRGAQPSSRLPAPRTGEQTPWLVVADGSALAFAPGLEALTPHGPRVAAAEARLREASARGPLALSHLLELQRAPQVVHADAITRAALTLAGPVDGAAARAARVLKEWDGFARAESRGAVVYQRFLSALAPALFSRALGAEVFDALFAMPRARPAFWISEALEAAAHGGDWERAWTEPSFAARAVRESLAAAGAALPERLLFAHTEEGRDPHRSWARQRSLRVHALWPGALAGARALGPLAYGREVQPWRPRAAAEVQSAPVYRFAVDAAWPKRAWSALSTGARGGGGRSAAERQLKAWRAGSLHLLTLSPEVVAGRPRLHLRPPPRTPVPAPEEPAPSPKPAQKTTTDASQARTQKFARANKAGAFKYRAQSSARRTWTTLADS